MKQSMTTPAGGKRLIGRAMAAHPTIQAGLKSNTIVIIAGTTNGYIAEEILTAIDQANDFSRRRFFRGVSSPLALPGTERDQDVEKEPFPGDVVIVNGIWQKEKTIFNVVDDLREGDIILKGANALDMARNQAAILIQHSKGGTIGAAIQAVVGRRVQLILPVGLEKRITADLMELAIRINRPGSKGLRLWPVPGQVFTEIDAITFLSGATAELIASGGVNGAEGCCWFALSGAPEQVAAAKELIKSVIDEPCFKM